jgi:hypothetical protein
MFAQSSSPCPPPVSPPSFPSRREERVWRRARGGLIDGERGRGGEGGGGRSEA